MNDRVPSPGKEGRVKLTTDAGQVIEGKLEMADDPTQVGTPLNKGTLFSDLAESAYGFIGAETPSEAFEYTGVAVQALVGSDAYVRVRVLSEAAEPLANLPLEYEKAGVVDQALTDASGYTTIIIPGGGTAELRVKEGYIDVSGRMEIKAEPASFTSVTFVVNALNFVRLDSSQALTLSPAITRVDLCLVGGGCSGYRYNPAAGGPVGGASGGSGGEVLLQEMVDVPLGEEIQAVVGAGGVEAVAASAGINWNPGGDTSFLGYTAKGGNALGGAGSNGRNPAVEGADGSPAFSGFDTLALWGAAGGGGAYANTDSPANGGSVGGGRGGTGGYYQAARPIPPGPGSPGSAPGAGGGGGGGGRTLGSSQYTGNGGAGADGVITMRIWHGEETA